jgi:Tol biopolymer transport system component
MKINLLTTVFVFCFFSLFSQTLQTTLKDNQEVLVLQEELYDQISWVNGDHRIAFVSKFEGSRNIYYIDLRSATIDKITRNNFKASYLTQELAKKMVYKPLTEPNDTNYYQPDWSPLGNDLVCLADYENKNEVFLIRVVDKKITPTGLQNIHLVHWFSNDDLYYVESKNRKKLMKYNRITGQKIEVKQFENEIIGFTGKSRDLVVVFMDGVYKINFITKKEEFYPLPIQSNKVYANGPLSYVAKDAQGKIVHIDLNNKKMIPLVEGTNNSIPYLSESGDYLAYFSSTQNGLVIKKIPKL